MELKIKNRLIAVCAWALRQAINKSDLELRIKAIEWEALSALLVQDTEFQALVSRRKARISKAQVRLVRLRANLAARLDKIKD